MIIGKGLQGIVTANNNEVCTKTRKFRNEIGKVDSVKELYYAKIASEIGVGPKIYSSKVDNTEISFTMEKVIPYKYNYDLTDEDKNKIKALFEKLSKQSPPFLPVDFFLGYKDDKWYLVDYGVTLEFSTEEEFWLGLKEYLDEGTGLRIVDVLIPILEK